MRQFESCKDAEQFASRVFEALVNQFPGAIAMADGDRKPHGLIFPGEEVFTVHYRIHEPIAQKVGSVFSGDTATTVLSNTLQR